MTIPSFARFSRSSSSSAALNAGHHEASNINNANRSASTSPHLLQVHASQFFPATPPPIRSNWQGIFTGQTKQPANAQAPHADISRDHPAVTARPVGGIGFMDICGGWDNLTRHGRGLMKSIKNCMPCVEWCCGDDADDERTSTGVAHPNFAPTETPTPMPISSTRPDLTTPGRGNRS